MSRRELFVRPVKDPLQPMQTPAHATRQAADALDEAPVKDLRLTGRLTRQAPSEPGLAK